MITTLDIAWLAGILEGEGCFGSYAAEGRIVPFVDVSMSDKDVVARSAALVGVATCQKVDPRKETYKTQYKWRATGRRAIGVMLTVYPLMGVRRQAKIRDTVALWRTVPHTRNAPGMGRRMATCHPERRMAAKGLCGSCYQMKWHKEHPR